MLDEVLLDKRPAEELEALEVLLAEELEEGL